MDRSIVGSPKLAELPPLAIPPGHTKQQIFPPILYVSRYDVETLMREGTDFLIFAGNRMRTKLRGGGYAPSPCPVVSGASAGVSDGGTCIEGLGRRI